MTTAFVLSGGGSLGAVQAGMLRSLQDAGVVPDLVVGTGTRQGPAPPPRRSVDMTPLPRAAAPTRRAALLGACGACAAAALSACGGSQPAETGGSSTTTGAPERQYGGGGSAAPVVLATLADIPVGGSISAETADGHPVLLHRRGDADVVAFSAVCTHQGCTVAPDGAAFTCPCHGSRYDGATGDVVNGPAPRPLEPFPVRVQDGAVVPA